MLFGGLVERWSCLQIFVVPGFCEQVFLGDQSVGKTSIITRFMYDKFDNTYQVRLAQGARGVGCPMALANPCSHRSGDNRHRLPLKDDVPGGPDCAASALVGDGQPA